MWDSFCGQACTFVMSEGHYVIEWARECPANGLFAALTTDSALLDAVEWMYKAITEWRAALADDLLAQVNRAFAENDLGFRILAPTKELIREDSDALYEKVTAPLYRLLRDVGYESAEGEFLEALRHHRMGEPADAIKKACDAYESCLKLALADLGETGHEHDTAKPLIEKFLARTALAPALQTSLVALPNLANKAGRHGAGSGYAIPPDERTSALAIHLAGSLMLFVVDSCRSAKAGSP